MRTAPLLLSIILFAACAERGERTSASSAELPPGVQALSLLGEPLTPPELPQEVRTERERHLTAARAEYENDTTDIEALIWLGRRTAYLGDYREAVAIYGDGIRRFPDEPRLYRHRGHRFITLRQFDDAIADLEHAARLIAGQPDQIEPDGLPNPRNIPTSTLQSNIWYHLGLAYYLSGDLANALRAYRECLKVSGNPDMLVATSHWLYMTLRRLQRDEEAATLLEPIHAGMDIIENNSYHRLLLMYKGELNPELLLQQAESGEAIENATLGYGIGNWYLYGGQPKRAERIFRTVHQGSQWAAFGFIAAEADLARLGDRQAADED